jgi:hypothetical protein
MFGNPSGVPDLFYLYKKKFSAQMDGLSLYSLPQALFCLAMLHGESIMPLT